MESFEETTSDDLVSALFAKRANWPRIAGTPLPSRVPMTHSRGACKKLEITPDTLIVSNLRLQETPKKWMDCVVGGFLPWKTSWQLLPRSGSTRRLRGQPLLNSMQIYVTIVEI
ncbi:hypothetical protein HNY73_017662 [Argiope bruennichi]|uniref:Uncharacterized protein n=1 Tax=Argiope bruennichi TaxID=94029 RepID=A0A8T0EBD1_ARGBR|nr:hypothetical protein HNY73_017662 [Argiope bruennichi]